MSAGSKTNPGGYDPQPNNLKSWRTIGFRDCKSHFQ
jgi:hypothetical protein